LAADEKPAKEIGALLKISRKTVDNDLRTIRQKFGKKKMVGILKLAVSKGILPVEVLMGCR
jgi:DNA-binding CsgD family transcriptional regulator